MLQIFFNGQMPAIQPVLPNKSSRRGGHVGRLHGPHQDAQGQNHQARAIKESISPEF